MRFLFVLSLILLSLLGQTHAQNPDPSRISVLNHGNTISIKPSGFQNGLDSAGYSQDSINIIWAAANVNPSGEIDLKEGVFHISRTLWIVGFQGTISGAGLQKTKLVARGPLINGTFVFPPLTAAESSAFFLPGLPHIFVFQNAPFQDNWQAVSTNLVMQELSITVQGQGPEQNYFDTMTNNVWAAVLMVSSQAVYNSSASNRVEHISGSFRNMHIYGQGYDLPIGTNLQEGILVFGGETWVQKAQPSANGWDESAHLPVNAVISVKNCKFTNTWTQAVGAETPMSFPVANSPILNSVLTFPPVSTPYPPAQVTISNNVFENVARGTANEPTSIFATFTLSPSGTQFEFSNNEFFNLTNHAIAILAGGAITRTNYPQDFNQVLIEHNSITMIPPVSSARGINSQAIFIADFNLLTGAPSIATIIRDNTLIAESGYASNLIEHLIGTATVIIDNTFYGSAQKGIVIGNQAFPNGLGGYFYLPAVADNVQGNDFTAFHASVADILLGPGSVECTVIQPNTTVIDQGSYNVVVTV